jgi:hypothetical protein
LPVVRDYEFRKGGEQLSESLLAARPIFGENTGPPTKGDRTAMFADQVERMKRDYTDKYVLVDASRPELARFRDVVGRVKTVNMNGRALVEFDDYHLNIGWYDIAPEYLKVVDQPPPKPAKTEAKKSPAKAAPAEKKAAGAAPAKAAGKPSVADILAAARGNKPAGGAPAAKPKAEATPAKAGPAAAPKVDRSKMSVADMIAAAKAGGAAGSAAAAVPNAAPAEPAAAAPSSAPAKKAAPPAAKSTETIDKSKMAIEDMIKWCREHDAK